MRLFRRRGSEVIDPQLTGLRFDQVKHKPLLKTNNDNPWHTWFLKTTKYFLWRHYVTNICIFGLQKSIVIFWVAILTFQNIIYLCRAYDILHNDVYKMKSYSLLMTIFVYPYFLK